MEKTVSFHSHVHKITFFLLSHVLIATIKEEFCQQLCLAAVLMGRGREGSKADLQSSAALLFPEHLLQREEYRRDLENMGVKVFVAHGPLLKHLWQCCLPVAVTYCFPR